MIGNRGDISSRWGILTAFHDLGVTGAVVFTDPGDDLPPTGYQAIPYGRLWNTLPTKVGWRALRQGHIITWSVGLDLQDDSSLAKLFYIFTTFLLYRSIGLSIWVLCQGAGPLETTRGRYLTSQILKLVDVFVARDPGTYALVRSISPGTDCILAHDAIFFPQLDVGLTTLNETQKSNIDSYFEPDGRPVIGINMRQWFHFVSSILPYELARKKFEQRSQDEMKILVDAFVALIQRLKEEKQARFLLVSAYKPDIVPWEDDTPWLKMIKDAFLDDEDIQVVESQLSVPEYFYLMSRLDMMIGMRLHSVLIALRFGVPAINISYTLKGKDIMDHLGLEAYVCSLDDFIATPEVVSSKAFEIFDQYDQVKTHVQTVVTQAMADNEAVLKELLSRL